MIEIFFKFFVLKLLVIMMAPIMALIGTVMAFKLGIFGVKHQFHAFDEAYQAAEELANKPVQKVRTVEVRQRASHLS